MAGIVPAVVMIDVRPPTAPCAAVSGWKFRAGTKNSCDAVVAEFFEALYLELYRNAFHPKARSHGPLGGLGGLNRSTYAVESGTISGSDLAAYP